MDQFIENDASFLLLVYKQQAVNADGPKPLKQNESF
jgi:hypothetical protein